MLLASTLLQLTVYGVLGPTGVNVTGCVEVDSSSGVETNSQSSTGGHHVREMAMKQETATHTTVQVRNLAT